MLQKTPEQHFGSNGGYLVCSCENIRRNSGTAKKCILVPKRTSSSLFCMHSGSQMLQNTPKHSVRAKTFVGTSAPRNSALLYRNAPVSQRFACIWLSKCSKALPNINLGLMEAIRCVRAKKFVGTLYPEIVHYCTETHQFLIVLHSFG